MSGISFKIIKDCIKTKRYLKDMGNKKYVDEIIKCGAAGVSELSAATPVDTGKTASSWSYEIKNTGSGVSVQWTNSNVTRDGTPIAIMLQYGHGTGTGGYVVGRDYINPAIAKVAQEASENVHKAVVPK